MADINPTLMKKVFDVSERQWKSDMHEHGELDDFGRGFEVAKRVLGHFPRLNARIDHLKASSPDNAAASIEGEPGDLNWVLPSSI